MDLWGWAVVLLFVALVLTMLEVFVPSGGLIGTLAVVAAVAAVVLAFRHSLVTGLGVAGAAVVLVPVVLSMAFHIWPQTRIGRRVLLQGPDRHDVLPLADVRRELQQLVGKVGRASSLMLPSGSVEIEGRNYDALSEGLAIEAGQRVKVVEVRGTRVVVRPTSESASPPTDSDDPLSQSIESLGLDPFDDPLA